MVNCRTCERDLWHVGHVCPTEEHQARNNLPGNMHPGTLAACKVPGCGTENLMGKPTRERRCAICGEVAAIHDGVVRLDLCESDECGDAAWERAFRSPPGPMPTPSPHTLKAALHEAWVQGTEQMPCPCESLARKVSSHKDCRNA